MADEPTEFWGEFAVDPIEIALPGGSGFTLRAYRSPSAVTGTDVSERELEEDPFAAKPATVAYDDELPDFDEDELERQALGATDTSVDLEPVVGDADTDSGDEESGDESADDGEDSADLEEVPLFLTHKGKLLVFKSAEGLVDFVKSKAPHDLTQLAEWPSLTKALTVEDVEVPDEDSYELDLVVENLRGGHDVWDNELLLSSGEIARDLAYALSLSKVTAMLSPGSPLDDLDEALRAATAGGVGGFLAKRRVRKIGAQQASIGWRTVIGNIAANVDWRD